MAIARLVAVSAIVLSLPLAAQSDIRHITVLGINDIHGVVESEKTDAGEPIGGLAFFAGVVNATRQANQDKYGKNGGVVVVDAGDQFQGTLISNYSEGALVFSILDRIKIDAAVPGNHDYDFGPIGWEEDKVQPGTGDQNPRGAIEKIAKQVNFPLLAANVYLQKSLHTPNGHHVQVETEKCNLISHGLTRIDWKKAKRPSFLKKYRIIQRAGVRIALIGLDNSLTPRMTTLANVEDLCFRDETETLDEIAEELRDKADIRILIIHQGDAGKDTRLSEWVKTLAKKPYRIDAVVAGHTHYVNQVVVDDIPIMQSGWAAQRYGRIDFDWDASSKTLLRQNTRIAAGTRMLHHQCDPELSQDLCAVTSDGNIQIEGLTVTPEPTVASLIQTARQQVDMMAKQPMGHAHEDLDRDRISESPLANILTDAFRNASAYDASKQKANIVFINTGGIRDKIPAGTVKYEDLFRVLPFNNCGYVVGPMTWGRVQSTIERSIRTCGAYGAVMPSGITVEYRRDCRTVTDGVDKTAELLKVTLVDSNELLFDKQSGFSVDNNRPFIVGILDFLHEGGSGFSTFVELPLIKNLGNLRKLLAAEFEAVQPEWTNQIDNRWHEVSGFGGLSNN